MSQLPVPIRPRVKQAATAASALTFNLTGVAAAGFNTFLAGMMIPVSTDVETLVESVPVLIEPTSGAGLGHWLLCWATLSREAGGVLRLTTSAGRYLASDQMSDSTLIPPTIVAGDAVTVTLTDPGTCGLALRGLGFATDGTAVPPTVKDGGLAALGEQAQAIKPGALALGRAAFGLRAYGAVVGGNRAASYDEASLGTGLGAVKPLGTFTAEAHVTRAVKLAATADATPAPLTAFDPDTATAGVTDAIADAERIYCDAGVSVFEATLVAIDVATGDHKVWTLRWRAKTALDFSTTTLLGALSATVDHAAAGASAWTVAVATDDASNSCTLSVTGAAATNISWHLDLRGFRAAVYL